MLFNAIVLAGGRSSRLGAGDKALLAFDGRSLVEIAVAAAGGAAVTVVVGPPEITDELTGVLCALEEPRFSGPAAALAAGLETLTAHEAEWTAVLSCDLPFAEEALAMVLAAVLARADDVSADGMLALDQYGREQPLLAAYRTAPLRAAIAALGTDVAGASFRSVTSTLALATVALPGTLGADVDTQQDAARFGIDVASSYMAQTSIR